MTDTERFLTYFAQRIRRRYCPNPDVLRIALARDVPAKLGHDALTRLFRITRIDGTPLVFDEKPLEHCEGAFLIDSESDGEMRGGYLAHWRLLQWA